MNNSSSLINELFRRGSPRTLTPMVRPVVVRETEKKRSKVLVSAGHFYFDEQASIPAIFHLSRMQEECNTGSTR